MEEDAQQDIEPTMHGIHFHRRFPLFLDEITVRGREHALVTYGA